MGGTNIGKPLQFVYGSETIEHVPKFVFLLSGGSIANPDFIIEIAKKHSQCCRTFTVGIGNGVSSYVIREIAKNGRGKCEFIINNHELKEKMTYLF